MARIIRDEVRQIVRDELQKSQSRKQTVIAPVRKARRLQPVVLEPATRLQQVAQQPAPDAQPGQQGLQGQQLSGATMVQQQPASQPQQQAGQMQQQPLPQQQQPLQQQSMGQQPAQMQQQQQQQQPQSVQSRQQLYQQLSMEMEANLLKLKKVISETQALAEKMESFLSQVGQKN